MYRLHNPAELVLVPFCTGVPAGYSWTGSRLQICPRGTYRSGTLPSSNPSVSTCVPCGSGISTSGSSCAQGGVACKDREACNRKYRTACACRSIILLVQPCASLRLYEPCQPGAAVQCQVDLGCKKIQSCPCASLAMPSSGKEIAKTIPKLCLFGLLQRSCPGTGLPTPCKTLKAQILKQSSLPLPSLALLVATIRDLMSASRASLAPVDQRPSLLHPPKPQAAVSTGNLQVHYNRMYSFKMGQGTPVCCSLDFFPVHR